ncbi:MAG: hypothetical protein ACI8PZ_002735 [Myxococcota bacterium]|jgi:hypothetical protein
MDLADVEAVLARLASDRSHTTRVERPCLLGDGITTLEDADEAAWRGAAEAGRLDTFIPASGAASRMLRDSDGIAGLPFDPSDPRWRTTPKGLVPFHRYPDGTVRTPVEEHAIESRAMGSRRLHLTVPAAHWAAFAARVPDAVLSLQRASTDVPAMRPSGEPVRDASGALVLRPGGHGALLVNVQDSQADVLLVKNVDNVVPDRHRAEVLHQRRRLVGRLIRLQARAHAALRAGDVGAAERFCADVLQCPVSGDAALARLDRPLRVAGMVRNTGEPGGGPFWVGRTPQIVEAAQLDARDHGQAAAATHFNSVDLALGLRDPHGQAYPLARFVDPAAVLITTRPVAGSPARVFERPGLWNGAMAHWNTVFVELPLSTFNPVKSVRDLLRPAHVP